MHVIVACSTPAVAVAYVRLVLLMVELAGHERCLDATVEVRPVVSQGALW